MRITCALALTGNGVLMRADDGSLALLTALTGRIAGGVFFWYPAFAEASPIGKSLCAVGNAPLVDLYTAVGVLQMTPCGIPGQEKEDSPMVSKAEHPSSWAATDNAAIKFTVAIFIV